MTPWSKDEEIVAAWAEYGSGPGWVNLPVWVLVRSRAGERRIECLQPGAQREEILKNFRVSDAVSRAMVNCGCSDD